MEITKHLFLNLSFLLILIFFGFIIYEKYKKLALSKPMIILFFAIMLWSCLQFSYHPVPYARFDLRLLPLVIGGAYLGIGPILVVVTILLRAVYGLDLGFYLNILLYVPYAIVTWKLYPWFWQQPPHRRVYVSVFLGLCLSILTIFGLGFSHFHVNVLDMWFAYMVIPSLGIGMISYCVEFFLRNSEMRQQLIKAEKLKAVEQMGAAISHEIRNPLTAASGFVQLLEDDYLPRHKRKEYLSIVKEELDSAERVIRDYLTFAKPSIDKFEELNVKSELKQIINIVQPLANKNSVEIITNYSVIGFIKGERQKFRQCFVNVMKNAIESMPNGGSLTITTEYNQNFVAIEIKDTGIGMTQEQLERLGEPFYSTKGKNGTGLGMMVVQAIVRAMNGTIRVESELGAGTLFHFEFPVFKTILEPRR
ncbi:GHKL domain-containing protein [Bacillus sp. BRMEA1]|uniref:ATP-binding protein n=1 Tax=Neobacillus endophyticus TaxID=2738405 RepID=UPI0015633B40|nr:ATP-binding protein [Neobacillus endophyticus]NRD78248.1 GHKL domain-containing protein [Neobacillus endophyticus]